jgi:hypothetical protein
MREYYLAAQSHGTAVPLTPLRLAQTGVSLTPLCKYDTAVTLDLIFEWL